MVEIIATTGNLRTKNGKFLESCSAKADGSHFNSKKLILYCNMTNDQIENFLKRQQEDQPNVRINFKTRPTIKGIFIQSADFDFLKSKNLWRIVSETKIDEFLKTKDEGLARIFNGTEFTKLA